MRVNIKNGVIFKEINDKYLCIIEALNLLPFSGYTPTITSANDGKHMDGSLHYKNHALDIRCTDLPKTSWTSYAELLKVRLGPEYDVVLEKDHIHVEYDPKPDYRR